VSDTELLPKSKLEPVRRLEVFTGPVGAAPGRRSSSPARLEEAIAAFHEALKELTREGASHDWAQIQANLGFALRLLGEYARNPARLEEAVVASRAAVEAAEAAGGHRLIEMFRSNLAKAEMALAEQQVKNIPQVGPLQWGWINVRVTSAYAPRAATKQTWKHFAVVPKLQAHAPQQTVRIG